MQRNRLWRTVVTSSLAITALTAFSLAGCGPGGSSASKVIKIGTSLAVSGGDASAQLPAQYGADLAISQNKDLGGGYTLEVVHKNYEGQSGPDANIGQADITALQNDPAVVAVVGPFNSGVAKLEIPVVNAGSGPVLISPANTNPGLTLEQYAQEAGVNFAQLHPAGKDNYYFRIPANDFLQGKADATIALTKTDLKPAAKTAFVVDDNTTYGKPLADFFTQFFKDGGGQVVGTRTSITADNLSVLPQLASAIIASKADTVFFGGVTSQGGCKLKKALAGAGYTKPMIGGDGIATDPGCISDAGAASAGLIATIAAPDPSTLTGGTIDKLKTDYAAFTANKPNNDFTPYAAQSYDAAMIEITAIKSLISAGKDVTRKAVRDAVASIQYTGAIGNISFDANGDNAGAKIFAVYAVLPGTTDWKYQTTITF
jgi:branched-chain amino acid transport system substrate-binding protein